MELISAPQQPVELIVRDVIEKTEFYHAVCVLQVLIYSLINFHANLPALNTIINIIINIVLIAYLTVNDVRIIQAAVKNVVMGIAYQTQTIV
jgi:hypothetical protein